MDPSCRMIKEEFSRVSTDGPSSSSSPFMLSFSMANDSAARPMNSPIPMQGLDESGPPPFLTKTYEIVEDSRTNHIVSWSPSNNSFIVWDPQTFSMTLLPSHFKHSNFSSFVRQLNTYGFRKIDPDQWEFANECFLRGQKHLLKNIRRRKTHNPRPKCSSQQQQQKSQDSCVEVGNFGLDGEIDRLKRDKQVMMMELVRLRQQQENTRDCVILIEEKLKRTETTQQQMMSFLVRAMQNPDFLNQLVQQKAMRKEIEGVIHKKRRQLIDQGPSNVINVVDDDDDAYCKIEQETYGGDTFEFEISDLDRLAMDIQGLGNSRKGDYGNLRTRDQFKEMYNEVFWEDLLSEEHNNTVQEETGVLGGHHEEDEDNVDFLTEQLGYLGSCPHD